MFGKAPLADAVPRAEQVFRLQYGGDKDRYFGDEILSKAQNRPST